MIVDLGTSLRLPCIDFISANDYHDWTCAQFIRTSYDASWLHQFNDDPALYRWSYFRSHGMSCLTPITVGIEFLDEYHQLPEARVNVLREAARRGIRAGFSIPLRQYAPAQSALMTFAGDLSRSELLEVIRTDGWTLNAGALAAHQRYLLHFAQEFPDRNSITPKQQELLELIGGGLLDKQIAELLDISVSAVRQRLNALLQKTGMNNRVELATLAMSLGVLPHPLSRPERDARTLVGEDVYVPPRPLKPRVMETDQG
ncbi:helix-turn-helix transcriptional regulator [Tropicibacter naphthalenivorans]|uniref:helix-turn-helix transcriptional regulator n=1 Tax=Tropicibacter naphthalenivorans TaxID=441103 RepID=UPI00135647A1|nr:LuxR C-terminal-related transcriptional regulator [Tropicibacter naphthalenivorans]